MLSSFFCRDATILVSDSIFCSSCSTTVEVSDDVILEIDVCGVCEAMMEIGLFHALGGRTKDVAEISVRDETRDLLYSSCCGV